MSDWTRGYVADVDYISEFHRELSPTHLSFALLTQGLRAPTANRRFRYCELGCGAGFSANVVAASHPDAEFWATDFNPNFAASGRRLAENAGLDNIHFFDKSFAEFAQLDLPQFDVITLHGIYSWVMAEHRQEIVAFIRDRLNNGGIVYVSYNCLPGLAQVQPLRRLMTEAAERAEGTLDRRIDAALSFAQRLAEHGAGFFAEHAAAKAHLASMPPMSRRYLAHEYFNFIWTPLYHVDVARQMHAAKLSFAASADMAQQLDRLCLSPEQSAVMAEAPDLAFREMLRDYILNQRFRRDVFARGIERLRPAEARETLKATRLALSVPRGRVTVGAEFPQGLFPFDSGAPRSFLDALGEGPKSLGDLMSAAELSDSAFAPALEMAMALVSSRQVQPARSRADAEAAAPSAHRLNAAILNRSRFDDHMPVLASPLTGGGIDIDRWHRLMLLARVLGRTDTIEFVRDTLRAEADANPVSERPLPNPEVLAAHKMFLDAELMPVLRQHGIA
jgi:predicted O-methyltransferase YrrM